MILGKNSDVAANSHKYVLQMVPTIYDVVVIESVKYYAVYVRVEEDTVIIRMGRGNESLS